MPNQRYIKVFLSDLDEIEESLNSADEKATEFAARGATQDEREQNMAFYYKKCVEDVERKFDIAETTLRKSIESPQDAGTSEFIAAQIKGLYSKAKMYRIAAIKFEGVDPEEERAYNEQALALLMSSRSLVNAPHTAFLIGGIHKDLGNKEKALQFYQEAERLDPDGDLGLKASKEARNIVEQETDDQIKSAKKSCFIATAAMGNEDAHEVIVLRRFRDEVLLRNRAGRSLVDIYYRISPSLADYLKNNDHIRALVRDWCIVPISIIVGRR